MEAIKTKPDNQLINKNGFPKVQLSLTRSRSRSRKVRKNNRTSSNRCSSSRSQMMFTRRKGKHLRHRTIRRTIPTSRTLHTTTLTNSTTSQVPRTTLLRKITIKATAIEVEEEGPEGEETEAGAKTMMLIRISQNRNQVTSSSRGSMRDSNSRQTEQDLKCWV